MISKINKIDNTYLNKTEFKQLPQEKDANSLVLEKETSLRMYMQLLSTPTTELRSAVRESNASVAKQ